MCLPSDNIDIHFAVPSLIGFIAHGSVENDNDQGN
jgi:hypothetical protein